MHGNGAPQYGSIALEIIVKFECSIGQAQKVLKQKVLFGQKMTLKIKKEIRNLVVG